jgi:acetyltransferase
MAFIAEVRREDGTHETLGVARAHADPDNVEAEFAILVRSDLKRHGLGSILLEKLIRYCRARGIQRLTGEVLADNTRMLEFVTAHGFHTQFARAGSVDVALELGPPLGI